MMTSSNENIFALLAICAGNSPVISEFPTQRPVTRSFGVFFDLRLNKRMGKQSWGWWLETPSFPLWRHCNESFMVMYDGEVLLSKGFMLRDSTYIKTTGFHGGSFFLLSSTLSLSLSLMLWLYMVIAIVTTFVIAIIILIIIIIISIIITC